MLPKGFNAVLSPVSVGRGEHIMVKVSVDKKQTVTLSINAATAAEIGMGEKVAIAVNSSTNEVGVFPVADVAGWAVSTSIGEATRYVVKIPMPALFNKVVQPFRSQSMTGLARVQDSGLIVDFTGIIAGESVVEECATDVQEDSDNHQCDVQEEATDAHEQAIEQDAMLAHEAEARSHKATKAAPYWGAVFIE